VNSARIVEYESSASSSSTAAYSVLLRAVGESELPAGEMAVFVSNVSLLTSQFAVPYGVAYFNDVVSHLRDQLAANPDVAAVGLHPLPAEELTPTDPTLDWDSWVSSPLWVVRLPLQQTTSTKLPENVRRVPQVHALFCRGPVADGGLMPALEPRPYFNPEHYPTGVNATYKPDCETLAARYTGDNGILEGAEGRELAKHPGPVVALCFELLATGAQGSEPPFVLLELGCGTGLFTAQLGAVPGITVVATDTSAGFIELCRQRQAKRRIPQDSVVLQLSPPDALPGVPTASVSACAIIDVYHHLEYPVTLLKDVRRTMRSGGMLLLIDFHRDAQRHYSHADPNWVLDHVRGDQATFEAEIAQAGFEKLRDVTADGITENYIVVFRATPHVA